MVPFDDGVGRAPEGRHLVFEEAPIPREHPFQDGKETINPGCIGGMIEAEWKEENGEGDNDGRSDGDEMRNTLKWREDARSTRRWMHFIRRNTKKASE